MKLQIQGLISQSSWSTEKQFQRAGCIVQVYGYTYKKLSFQNIVDLSTRGGPMKKYFPFLILILFVTSCAGSLTRIPASEKIIHITRELPGQTQQQILVATRNWMEKYFTTYVEPIVFEDREEGTITGNGEIDYPCSWPGCVTKGNWKVSFNMRIDAEDGIVRTWFRNIRIFSPPSDPNAVSR